MEAVKWYRKAAEHGLAEAQFNLGNMYEQGEGLAEDREEAIQWYTQAAEQGLVLAQAALGSIYAGGVGVPQNEVTAYLWWSLSSEQGHKIAEKNVGILRSRMTTEQLLEGEELVKAWKKRSH